MKQIGWIAGESGIEKVDPKPPGKVLSEGERLASYARGMRLAADVLEKIGFKTIAITGDTVSLQYKRFLFDFKICDPRNVAHVTSSKLYVPGSRNATITTLKCELQCHRAIQIIASGERSDNPVYVPLTLDIVDPVRYILEAVFLSLRAIVQQQTSASKDLRELINNARVQDYIGLLSDNEAEH